MKWFALIIYALQVLHGLESATNCLEDMNEWLGMFNVKLRHMREDIESVSACSSWENHLLCNLLCGIYVSVFTGTHVYQSM